MSAEIYKTPTGAHAPPEVQAFADRMSAVQGCRVVLSREATGYHLYLPCPDCLFTHGKSELADPKYAINLSKYLEIGDGFRQLGMVTTLEAMKAIEKKDTSSSICMRTRQSKEPHRHNVTDLLSMTTITQRHPELLTKAEVAGGAGSADREEHWEKDEESGVMCPPPAGDMTPINQLPADHPAVEYLTRRGYDMQKLWEQFRCSYCYREYPEGVNGIYYRKMPAGWKDTPQGRIIFHALHKGAPMTWQARVIEKLSDDKLDKFMLHPYDKGSVAGYPFVWSHVATRPNETAAWIPVPPFDETASDGTLKFQPSKYRTAKYSTRELMGWDAAMLRAARDMETARWVVLCEGPLDAARVGPGGVALIGSSINPVNAEMVANNFHIAFMAFDEDKAGRGATEKVGKMLLSDRFRGSVMQLPVVMPVPVGKDIGEMSQEAFDAMLARAIKKSGRGM